MTIKQFISENINIPNNLWEKAVKRVNSIKDALSTLKIIDSFDYQGSYSRKTIIRPKTMEEEFDIDITANHSGTLTESESYRFKEIIHDKLKQTYPNKTSSITSKPTKAIEVKFNKEFHIDIVPLSIDQHGEHVFDALTYQKQLSNPLILTQKFNENASKHPGNSLRDAIKLIKYIRRLCSIDSKDIPSIMFDIYYSQIKKLSNNYDENIIELLSKFQHIPTTILNPYCENEEITIKNHDEFDKLKLEIQNLIEKLSNNDFNGLKQKFKTMGATFGISVAAVTSAASHFGSGGVSVSSDYNNRWK